MIKNLMNFVIMCSLLYIVFVQIKYINADWCSAEVDILKEQSYSIINHFGITLDD